jgi:hypothetical protein
VYRAIHLPSPRLTMEPAPLGVFSFRLLDSGILASFSSRALTPILDTNRLPYINVGWCPHNIKAA